MTRQILGGEPRGGGGEVRLRGARAGALTARSGVGAGEQAVFTQLCEERWRRDWCEAPPDAAIWSIVQGECGPSNRRLAPIPASIAPAREVIVSPLRSHAEWTEHEQQSWYRQLEREVVAEAAAKNGGRSYRSPEYFRTVCAHTTVELEPSDAPGVYVAEGDVEARQRWRAKIRAFTAAWREALATWINGGEACFPVGGCRSGRVMRKAIRCGSRSGG